MAIEATIYRKALLKLNALANDGRRKSLSMDEVRDITRQAIDAGNQAQRSEKDR